MDSNDKTFEQPAVPKQSNTQSKMDSVSTKTDSSSLPSSQVMDIEGQQSSSSTTLDADPATTCSEDIPEGHRMHQLRKGLERLVAKCVSAGRYSLFMAHLPALGSMNPRALKAIHTQYLQKLNENIQCEIETMFKEENMASVMGELYQIIEDTPFTDIGAWRPTSDVKENLRPHVMAVKEKQRKRLQDTLSSLDSENKQLQEVLLRKRQKLQHTTKQCKSFVDAQVVLN